MDVQRYLTEETVEDYADRLISRREALRRLALLGLDAAGAIILLAACGRTDDRTTSTPRPTDASPTTQPSPSPVATEPITFPGPTATLQGAWALSPSPKGAALVIHENRGLNDHTRSVAGRLASDGYSSLALDLLSEEGGTAKLGDEAAVMAALSNAPKERFIADMKAAVSEISKRASGMKVGAIGFCFGGGQVWQLLADGEPRLAAAAPFYGPAPENPDFSKSKAAVLAVYGGQDARVNATKDAAIAALKKANLEHKELVYPEADHAFFNDTGPRYNPDAAAKAYKEVLDWFGRYV